VITKASVSEYDRLIAIWESSVRATHDFITEEEIQFYKPLILEVYFRAVDLYCYQDEECTIYGFIGVAGDKLEMLFIDAGERGKGIGKQLVAFAVNELQVTKVDVNEENGQAVNFYRYMGFHTIGRSEVDGTGKNHPLLFMELAK